MGYNLKIVENRQKLPENIFCVCANFVFIYFHVGHDTIRRVRVALLFPLQTQFFSCYWYRELRNTPKDLWLCCFFFFRVQQCSSARGVFRLCQAWSRTQVPCVFYCWVQSYGAIYEYKNFVTKDKIVRYDVLWFGKTNAPQHSTTLAPHTMPSYRFWDKHIVPLGMHT